MAKYHLPEIEVEWEKNTGLTSIQKKENAFVFRTSVGGKAHTFAVTFPVIGGVRITEKQGYFPCDGTLPITYSGKKTLKIAAGKQVVLFRKDEEKGFVLDLLNDKGKTVFSFTGDTVTFGVAGNKIKKVKKVKYTVPFEKDEMLYGLGAHFNALNQVGHELYLWNLDCDYHDSDDFKDSHLGYQNIPVLHSSKGYMLFFNTMYGAKGDFGVTTPYEYNFDFHGTDNDLFVFTGTPMENIKGYADITGHTVIPPKWAFQYWMGGASFAWEVAPYQQVLQEYVEGYNAMGTPVGTCYGEGYPSMYKEGYDIAKENNFRMLRWLGAYWHDYNQVKELLGSDDPKDLPFPLLKNGNKWEPGTRWIDFSHPNAAVLAEKLYGDSLSWGCKGSMVDFGEYLHPLSKCANGKDGMVMHQENTLHYNRTIKELFDKYTNGDHILFSRSGCAGSQKYMGQFGGDQRSTYHGLNQAFNAGITAGASGFNIWGSDIGGFKGEPGKDLYLRWLEFGTFSPLMRAHGFGCPRNPWYYDDETVEAFKKYYWWRENMVDHVYSMAIHANKTSEPMMRAMAVAFPDQEVKSVEKQYMFGAELLVAPVLEQWRRCKDLVLPKGDWFHLWTGKKVTGDRKLTVTVEYTDIPVYLRAGAAMVLTLPEETLTPCETMLDKEKVQALLVTPADSRREVKHWVDPDNYVTFVTEKVGEEAVTVTNVDGYDCKAVLVYGVKAEKVLVDGKEIAFTIDGEKVTVRTPKGFKKLEVY